MTTKAEKDRAIARIERWRAAHRIRDQWEEEDFAAEAARLEAEIAELVAEGKVTWIDPGTADKHCCATTRGDGFTLRIL